MAELQQVEAELAMLRRELILAYRVIDAMPSQAYAHVSEVHMLELVRAQEAAEKRVDVETTFDLQADVVKAARRYVAAEEGLSGAMCAYVESMNTPPSPPDVAADLRVALAKVEDAREGLAFALSRLGGAQ